MTVNIYILTLQMNNTITEQWNQKSNITNFFRWWVYNSVESAILASLQSNPTTTSKINKTSEFMTKEEEQKFMQQNFPWFDFSKNK